MNVISQANETVLAVLKRFLKTDFQGRLSHYCVTEETEDGILLFNLMTRELVLLTAEEYAQATQLEYLRQRWFVVPEQMNEKECMEFVRLVLKAKQQGQNHIAGYTIFTTTDCNARCFYCFELGRSRIPMSIEVAEKTAAYIKSHCGGKQVRLNWFGGEPLMNPAAIDTICDRLQDAGIEYESSMVSNGYLFDEEMATKAAGKWNLKKVQITLDGTEDVYNRIKAFVEDAASPYRVVLRNIQRVLDRGIKVVVRLNMDLHNAEDLLTLVEELAQRFRGQKLLRVYAHHLFQADVANAEMHSEEEWHKREEAMARLNAVIARAGLEVRGGISTKVKMSHCMADSGRAVTILPDGNIGLCEHYSETEFIGHLDREGLDTEMVASWKALMPEIPECAECFYYPECFKLKKCTSESQCYPTFRRQKRDVVGQKMRNTYKRWLKQDGPESTDVDEDFVGND